MARSKVEIRINRAGIVELLKDPGVQADLRRRGERVAAAAGPGHRVESAVGKKRARSAVIIDDWRAARNEAKNRTLTTAFGAARGG